MATPARTTTPTAFDDTRIPVVGWAIRRGSMAPVAKSDPRLASEVGRLHTHRQSWRELMRDRELASPEPTNVSIATIGRFAKQVATDRHWTS